MSIPFVAIDTETTGLDIRHGCRPFFISTWTDTLPSKSFLSLVPKDASSKPYQSCLKTGLSSSPEKLMRSMTQVPYINGKPAKSLEGYGYNYLLDYNKQTRQTNMSLANKKSLALLLTSASIVFHNAFFDMSALASVGIYLNFLNHPTPFSTTDLYNLPSHKHFPDPHDKNSIVIDCHDFHDTMISCHVYDSKGPKGLKDAAIHYLLVSDTDETVLVKTTGKARRYVKRVYKDWKLGTDLQERGQTKYDYALPIVLYQHLQNRSTKEKPISFEEALTPIVYGSLDAYRTLLLYYTLDHLIDEEGRLEHYEDQRAQLTPCYRMQSVGLSLSNEIAPLRTQLSKSIFLRKQQVRKQAKEITPNLFTDKPFNPNSHDQLREVLFSRKGFNLPVLETTKKGKPCTSSTVRKTIAATAYLRTDARSKQLYNFLKLITSWSNDDPNFPFPEENTGYDAWTKSVGYLSAYLRSSVGGTVHPSYNPVGTATTRYSCSNPNGQNIGKKSRVPLRRAFGPTEEWTWYAIDYSQLELRLFATASQDETLLSAFENGRDFHELVACEIFSSLPEKVSSSQRTAGKFINFGLIYGAGRNKIDNLAGFSGAYDRYRTNFASAADFMDKTSLLAARYGYIKTLYGYPLHLGADPPYKGTNYVIQGTAGQIVKYAMLDLNSASDTPVDWHKVRIILNVHDELIFAVHNSYDEADQNKIVNQIARIMARQGDRIGATTPVDCGIITSTWKEKQKYVLETEERTQNTSLQQEKLRSDRLSRFSKRSHVDRIPSSNGTSKSLRQQSAKRSRKTVRA